AYPEPPMYPEAPSYAPRSTRPTAPISIPSPNSNPGPFPNFPIPPPGIPATRTQVSLSAPPSPAPLPAGVRPPSAPRATGTVTGIRSSPTSSSSLPSYSSPSFSPRLSDGICSWISNEHACSNTFVSEQFWSRRLCYFFKPAEQDISS
ncbi:hypothetical protein V3C99_015501, partial [Haemonchus contortus]